MKTVELRVHTLRVKPAKGISEAGRRLAELAAETFGGAYHAYYSATSRRCRETLDALGFPTYDQSDLFGGLPEDLDRFERELLSQQLTTGCRYMEGYLAVPAARIILQARGEELMTEVRAIARKLHPGGRALVIAHAETVELAAMAARTDGAPGFPGGELRPLDGIAIDVVEDRVRQVRVIRLPGAVAAGAGSPMMLVNPPR